MKVQIAVWVLLSLGAPVQSLAAILTVPGQYPEIQAAVDAAEDGDIIFVGKGRWCGAILNKELHLVGHPRAVIVGSVDAHPPRNRDCESPTLFGQHRVGILLSGEATSGSSVRGFTFEGRGISPENLKPLAFGIFARDAHGVRISHNRIRGTVQGITNTRGDDWQIVGNRIEDLTLFPCPGGCGGGAGIVIQHRSGERSWNNQVMYNRVTGQVPKGHTTFDMVGIAVFGQDSPKVVGNRLRIRRQDDTSSLGIGILVAKECCGVEEPFATSTDILIVGNHGRESDFVLVVEEGNDQGARIHGNRGRTSI